MSLSTEAKHSSALNKPIELKPLWRKYFDFNWKFGLAITLLVCIPRFMLVLNANETANYRYIGLIMLFSAILPFLFLSKHGRTTIGLTRPRNVLWLLWSFCLGLLLSLALYAVGALLYGSTLENWYVYIGKSYNIAADLNADDRLIRFLIMASVGMIFSPIGEELFFRGLVHASFAQSFGGARASVMDGASFALVHISHFGLVFVNGQWHLLAIPTCIWVSGMFLASLLFYNCKNKSGSILGAILCHSAFNLGMTFCIFYLL